MKHYFRVIIITSIINSTLAFSETVPSIEITNYQSDLAYIINSPEVVVGKDYEDACKHLFHLGYTWKIIPTTDVNPACYSPTNRKKIGADTWYCADGSLAYYNTPWWYCSSFKVCPDLTWSLTYDKLNCTRPTLKCSDTFATVSEERLIAAIVHAEASPNAPYEEKAAIANALVRYSQANGYPTVNALIQGQITYSSAVNSNVELYRAVICSDILIEFPEEYSAALNALDPDGIDFANGGCFWDGIDLVTKGKSQKHYKKGYKFTNPLHDVYSIGNSDPVGKVDKFGTYNYTYESTAGYGGTVFWKLTQEYMTARRNKPCH